MDEFGSALRRVSELGRRKRIDAPAASVSRLQYGHFLARAGELACGHQARRARAYDDNMIRTWSKHGSITDRLPPQHPHSGSGTAVALRRLPKPGCSPASSPRRALADL